MKESRVITTTAVNNIPVDPTKSILPVVVHGDRVFIEPVESDGTLSKVKNLASGETITLVKPIGSQEDYKAGRIAAVGPGLPDSPVPELAKPGVVVNYFYQRGIPFEFGTGELDDKGKEIKKKYDLVRANDIILFL